jgi:ribosomal protein S18 acetylase RimI-like enzyme
MTAITVRRATSADVPGAAALARELVLQHHGTDKERFFLPDRVEQGYASWFRRELERPNARLLVAVKGDAVVGYAYGTLEGRDYALLLDEHGAVHDVFVAESARREGAGTLLLRELLHELEALGAKRIVLYTMVDNLAAQALFRSLGFRPTLLEMTRSESSPR